MTKTELEIAQFLHHTATRAYALTERIDPERNKTTFTVMCLEGVRRTATRGFAHIVGRTIVEVESITELNTESPAPWTRTKKNSEGRRPIEPKEATT